MDTMEDRNPGQGSLIKIRPRAATFQVSRGRTVLVTDERGEVNRDRAIEGLYIYRTRALGRYAWQMNGKSPEFSCASNIDQSSWMGYYIETPENCKETPTQMCNPLEETIELRLRRAVGEGMHEDVYLNNHTLVATDVKLQLQLEYQFISQKEVEDRKQNGDLTLSWKQPKSDVWELMADYRVSHQYDHQGNQDTAEMHRGLKLRIENADSPPEYSDNRLTFRVHLEPHGEWRACLSWLAYIEDQLLPLSQQCSNVDSSGWNRKRVQFFNSATSITVPHADDLTSTVWRVLNRARLDLGDLRFYDLDSPGGFAFAAGIPTYMEVFGRDMQAAAWQASMLSPDLLRGALNFLDKLPAVEKNDWRDAEPGRIPHELHTDPLAVLNFHPQSLYFGSASASFLFPIAVSELWHWTGDLDSVRRYVDTALGAIKWADTYSLDSTGFYRYKTHSVQGIKNQGWKDSSDAIVYPDGSQVEAPIGTCEMQAFMYVAKAHFSEVMWRLGQKETAWRLFREAEDLKKRFNEKFWMEDEGYYGMGIDSKGELIRSIGSDPGHCLLAAIISEDRIKRVANRMMQDDLFSGWGIRTLSSYHPAFNPFSYHRGSVWPVTNAVFVLGFSRFGLHGEMHRLAKAMFEAADIFEFDRLPEVFCGHQRSPDQPFPGLYTKANWPQAWTASAAFTILQALIGIHPYAPDNLLFVDPHLPEWLPEITVERLHVGKAIVSIRFHRVSDGSTAYEVTELQGTLHIVRQPSAWSLTSGWAERIEDVVESVLPQRKVS
jgi:glycogen debranching enzyme